MNVTFTQLYGGGAGGGGAGGGGAGEGGCGRLQGWGSMITSHWLKPYDAMCHFFLVILFHIVPDVVEAEWVGGGLPSLPRNPPGLFTFLSFTLPHHLSKKIRSLSPLTSPFL